MTEPGRAAPWTGDWGNKTAWTGEAAGRWLALEPVMDRALGPFGDAALARAQPRLGERAIDVGCGCGATTIALAESVGRTGHVLGVDVAAPFLARARERAAGFPQIQLLEADAATGALPRDRDLVFSRFGVMFFPDNTAAFRNLTGALRPGGRLVFVCWRRFEENTWLYLPFWALREVLPDAPFPPLDAPGPFALADHERLAAILRGAGLSEVTIERFDHPVILGPDRPPAVHLAMNNGPTGRILAGVDETTRARVGERIAAVLARQERPEGIALAGAAWVVTARRPQF